MYAKAVQGMPAEDAVKWAEGELKKIYASLHRRRLPAELNGRRLPRVRSADGQRAAFPP